MDAAFAVTYLVLLVGYALGFAFDIQSDELATATIAGLMLVGSALAIYALATG